jgi:protein-S-isoprenylcysteine O-methyltransferase Ste14
MKSKKHNNHDIHEHLGGEHKWNHTGQISFILIFSIAVILDILIFKFSIRFQELIPFFLRIPVAIPILILSYFLLNRSINIVFDKEQKEPKIIKSGIYSRVRHPIYLAPIIMYLGFIILSLSLLSLIIWILIIIFYYSMAKYEETLLLDKFENEYRDYMKEVPMFIPRILSK